MGGCQEEETQIGRKENSIVMKSSEFLNKFMADLHLDYLSLHVGIFIPNFSSSSLVSPSPPH